ncbi:hypothetical protein VP01_6282g1, partial [Puccinia sorghi]
QLYAEINKNREVYIKEHTFGNLEDTLTSLYPTASGPVGTHYWMEMASMADAIANAFERPVMYFSKCYSQTSFPHLCSTNVQPPIMIGLINKPPHFVSTHMKEGLSIPAPMYLKNWEKSAIPKELHWA